MDINAINQLVDEEWQLFRRTKNIGGRAACQDDYPTFFIMRTAQMMALNDEIVESCIKDIRDAVGEGRNPIAEKYAHMMQFTDFPEYFRLAFVLPVINSEKSELVRKIVDKTVAWTEEAQKKYPHIVGNGRVIHAYEDSFSETSVETYCYGEMVTRSIGTLKLIDEYYADLSKDGRNIWIMTQDYLVKMLGYSSIDDAESQLKGM